MKEFFVNMARLQRLVGGALALLLLLSACASPSGDAQRPPSGVVTAAVRQTDAEIKNRCQRMGTVDSCTWTVSRQEGYLRGFVPDPHTDMDVVLYPVEDPTRVQSFTYLNLPPYPLDGEVPSQGRPEFHHINAKNMPPSGRDEIRRIVARYNNDGYNNDGSVSHAGSAIVGIETASRRRCRGGEFQTRINFRFLHKEEERTIQVHYGCSMVSNSGSPLPNIVLVYDVESGHLVGSFNFESPFTMISRTTVLAVRQNGKERPIVDFRQIGRKVLEHRKPTT